MVSIMPKSLHCGKNPPYPLNRELGVPVGPIWMFVESEILSNLQKKNIYVIIKLCSIITYAKTSNYCLISIGHDKKRCLHGGFFEICIINCHQQH